MKTRIVLFSFLLFAAGLGLQSLAQTAVPGAPTGEIAAAANRFLGTLDDARRRQVVFAFADDAQRRRWSNFPTPMFKRAGLRLGDLTAPQREAAMAMLAAALSPEGYEKVLQIVEADERLRGSTGQTIFGRDEYYVSILGQPSTREAWMLQFGGHHLGLNVTLAGERGTLAPSHTGAQPAIYELDGKTVRPLGRESDKAFALVNSLDEAQRNQAILGVQMRDLVLGPGRDGQTIQPEGIKGSALTEKQRAMLVDLASEWIGILPRAAADRKLDEVRRDVADTWFAWSGPTSPGSAAYFRIQGPAVFIEYAPQTLGGDATKHIHTIYRDPANEYGVEVVDAMTAILRLSLLLVWLAWPPAAFAHRLDEYLQATLVAVEPDGIRLRVDLRPGVAVAGDVLALLDADGDGVISPGEGAAYAERLRRDLAVRLDGRDVALTLATSDFAEPDDLRAGRGTIRVEFAGTPGPLSPGAHRLAVENRHLGGMSAYLVNAAQPRSSAVRITAQRRNDTQSAAEVEFTLRESNRYAAAVLVAAVPALLIGFRHARSGRREKSTR